MQQDTTQVLQSTISLSLSICLSISLTFILTWLFKGIFTTHANTKQEEFCETRFQGHNSEI